MKKIVIAVALMMSSASFAIMAPVGEHRTLNCVSAQKGREFTVNVVKNTKNAKIKLVLEVEGKKSIVYPNAREIISTKMGAPVVYQAMATGGAVTLTVNFTTAPRPGGRLGVFTSAVYGRATSTEMLCSRVMY